MSEEMKMGDVFELPLQLAVNELAIIDKNDCVVGWADEFSGEVARDHIVNAVNNHDRLTEQVKQLRKALANVLYAESRNTGCEPSLSVFHRAVDDALELLEQTK